MNRRVPFVATMQQTLKFPIAKANEVNLRQN
jgi:hypothetical protein